MHPAAFVAGCTMPTEGVYHKSLCQPSHPPLMFPASSHPRQRLLHLISQALSVQELANALQDAPWCFDLACNCSCSGAAWCVVGPRQARGWVCGPCVVLMSLTLNALRELVPISDSITYSGENSKLCDLLVSSRFDGRYPLSNLSDLISTTDLELSLYRIYMKSAVLLL